MKINKNLILIFLLVGAGVWFAMRLTTGYNVTNIPISSDRSSMRAWFTNNYFKSGIDFVHISGQAGTLYMPEIMAGGVGLLDYDQDGYLDVYFVQSGYLVTLGSNRISQPGNKLYRNLGDGTFQDVTIEAGVGDVGYGMGCTCGDFNNDGLTDIYVTNVGPNVLYQNNGDGTFTDITDYAGVGDSSFSSSAAFLDYDHDGDLDLFVVNYIIWSMDQDMVCHTADGMIDYCKPTNYNAPAPDRLYRNNGDGTFTDVSESSGITAIFGNGLGVVAADFNGDQRTDICVANDETANQLWINQRDGTFIDEALMRGVAYSGEGEAEAGMGIDAQDIDGDSDYDIFMSHFASETNTLYINETHYLEDRTTQFGLTVSFPYTGFGTALIDLNNDGYLDNYVGNGRVIIGHGLDQQFGLYSEVNLLMQGLPNHYFQEVQPRGGTSQPLIHSSRGVAFGDYDNDGRIDIFVVNRDSTPYILNNLTDSENHWVIFDVRNQYGSPAIGARVEIKVNGRSYIRDVRAAYSYCASNDPRVHFGLGNALRIEHVQVTWTDGTVQSSGGFPADHIIEVRPDNP